MSDGFPMKCFLAPANARDLQRALLGLLALLLAATPLEPARAQEPPPPLELADAGDAMPGHGPFMDPGLPPEMRGQGPGNNKRARQRIRTMRAIALANQLELGEAKALKANAILAGFDDKRAILHQRAMDLFDKIEESSKADSINVAQLDSNLDALIATHTKMAALQGEEFRALEKLLTPRQRAKLVLFLRRFPQQIRRAMRSHHRARAKDSDRP